jgi:hypothetical protein
LEAELERGFETVKSLDPFKQIYTTKGACRRVACTVVTRWAMKSPENKRSAAEMHWTTFDAILKRNGGPYRSKSGEKREYNIPEAL